jgi:transketolase C-terminal domain/subunit
LPDHFPTHGDSDALRARYGLDAPAIADRALRFLREKRAPGE